MMTESSHLIHRDGVGLRLSGKYVLQDSQQSISKDGIAIRNCCHIENTDDMYMLSNNAFYPLMFFVYEA